MTNDKLTKLQPSDNTVGVSVEVEELSMSRIKGLVQEDEMNKDSINSLVRVLNVINKTRGNLKSEISVKARIFRDVSDTKEELKAYIEASFPKMLDSK